MQTLKPCVASTVTKTPNRGRPSSTPLPDTVSSHVADVVCHAVGGYPSFHQHHTEAPKHLQCSHPCVGVSISRVFPKVKGQLVWGRVGLQPLGKLQQLSRLDEVGAVIKNREKT